MNTRHKKLTPTLVPLVLLLTALQTASAYYDPGVQRWITRDPLGERGFETLRQPHEIDMDDGVNLYRSVLNDPANSVDPNGLTVWLCSRTTDWGVGNHVYFWDDKAKDPGKQHCGMTASNGKGDPASHDEKPPGTPGISCQPISASQDPMYASAIMGCCFDTANTGLYKPWGNDCHDKLDNCLTPYGITPPKHPRFGHPRVYPSPDKPPIFAPL